MSGKPFSLYPRKTKNGKSIWYCQFKQIDGTFGTARSTGETSRGRAEAWAIEQLKAGNEYVKGGNISLAEYAKDFFAYDGRWATDKKARGLRLSLAHCKNMTALLNNRLLPVFGSIPINQINRGMIKQFRNELYLKGYSGGSINKTLTGLKLILESAEEEEIIPAVPRIDRAADNPKVKGILTIEEAKCLFSTEWPDIRGYTANLLAATTGLRLGELQALTIGDIHFKDRYIVVSKAWDHSSRTLNTTTKTGKTRNIFFPAIVTDAISELINNNPWPIKPERYIFYSEILDSIPIDRSIIQKAFHSQLSKIGIYETERRSRNICFHSWRHWFNSLLINAKVPLQAVQSMTGHLTAEMSQRYYHLNNTEGMNLIKDVQESIFS